MASINPSSPTNIPQGFFTNDKDFMFVMRKNIQQFPGLCTALLCSLFRDYECIELGENNPQMTAQDIIKELGELYKFYYIFSEDPIIGPIATSRRNDLAGHTGVQWFLEPLFEDYIQKLRIIIPERPLINALIRMNNLPVSCLLLIQILLELSNVDINEEDEMGWTALFDAAQFGHLDIVQYLAEHHADINHRDHWGQTAFMLAASTGHLDIIKYFIEQQHVDINDTDYSQLTALMRACSNDHLDIVQYLVEKHADINARDYRGDTALKWAADKHHLNIVRYLENHQKANEDRK